VTVKATVTISPTYLAYTTLNSFFYVNSQSTIPAAGFFITSFVYIKKKSFGNLDVKKLFCAPLGVAKDYRSAIRKRGMEIKEALALPPTPLSVFVAVERVGGNRIFLLSFP